MIWLFIALMTGAAAMAVLLPLARRAGEAHELGNVAVYTDQLDEIARDQGFGLIAPAEADAARIEVSRRLIGAADAAARRVTPGAASPVRRRVVALIALFGVPVGALAVYLATGSPDLPGAPLAERIAQARGQQSAEEMFARVEQHLAQHPEDGRGWELLAPIYMRLNRYDDAVNARRNALRYLGETAERWSDLGEALIAAANGIVTGEAKTAFDNALRIDAKDITARFYGGLAAEQDGRKDEAARIWRALAADAPPGAPWLGSVQTALARVDPAAASAVPSPPPAAPGAAQTAMINAMVARLDARLHQDGADVDGWIRLVRSYLVLRQPDKARASAEDARKALAGDADKLARLETGLQAIAAGAPPTEESQPSPPAASNAPPAAPAQPQDEMIRGMVARLDARLHQDGSDVDGWIKLMRSYLMLKEPNKARAALADARNALKGDPDKLRQLDEGAKSLGVGG